ncbi:hypothetical protein ACFX2I_013473 [Malus domestica]
MVLVIISCSCWIERDPMSAAAWSGSSFTSIFSIRGSSSSPAHLFSGSSSGSGFLPSCGSSQLTSAAICKSFSSTIRVSLVIASFI